MLLYTVRRLILAPVRTSLSLLDAHLFPVLIRRKAGITLAGPIRVIGWPIVETSGGGEIHIGTDVTLNSRNRGYHVNMHSPVKLFADRPGAIIEIGASSRIHGACVHAYKRITIGRNCLIAANTQIIDCTGHDASFPDVANRLNTHGVPRRVVIEDNVWIGANCVILPGVRVGWGSIIAAGSIVFQGTIPPCSTVAGNPAQVLVSRPGGQVNRDEHSSRA